MQVVSMPPDRLSAVTRAIFRAAGSCEREACLIADHLVEANLRGHDSHGVGMIPAYVRNIRDGHLKPNRTLAVTLDNGSMLVCDADQGAGQVMAYDAMALGIDRARSGGSCIVALRNSHHIGRIGHWAEQCADAGLVSLHFVNVVSEPAVAPFGGTQARLGTNPFAVGLPRAGGPPIVVDFATSRWAIGKVRVALNRGDAVPPGTLLDASGAPSIDPAVMFDSPRGSLLTFGEHKGWGVALACELLAGALTGSQVQLGAPGTGAIINSMFSVIVSPDGLGASSFSESLEAVAAWVQSENLDDKPAIHLPGQPEQSIRALRLREGIPLDPATWEQIASAGESVGISVADPRP